MSALSSRRLGAWGSRLRWRDRDQVMVLMFGSSSHPRCRPAARKMGCYLITETMSRRHELSMESYDRLFPSQDTMPHGGFGNLIALPLQHGPRALGNSVFLDDQLRPYPDDEQWSYLASLPRIDAATVEQIAREATEHGSVVDVQVPATEERLNASFVNSTPISPSVRPNIFRSLKLSMLASPPQTILAKRTPK
jgi:hypothetical protein